MSTDNTEIKVYTVPQVAELFSVSQPTVIAMIRDGRLDGEKVGNRYKITEESIKRLILGDKG